MIGKLLADSGGADRIVDTIIGRVGAAAGCPGRWPLIAAILGLPLFFEVGVVLLVPVVILVARRTGVPLMQVGIPALAGLSVLHGLVPPHPGPLAAIDAARAPTSGRRCSSACIVAVPTLIMCRPAAGPVHRPVGAGRRRRAAGHGRERRGRLGTAAPVGSPVGSRPAARRADRSRRACGRQAPGGIRRGSGEAPGLASRPPRLTRRPASPPRSSTITLPVVLMLVRRHRRADHDRRQPACAASWTSSAPRRSRCWSPCCCRMFALGLRLRHEPRAGRDSRSASACPASPASCSSSRPAAGSSRCSSTPASATSSPTGPQGVEHLGAAARLAGRRRHPARHRLGHGRHHHRRRHRRRRSPPT